MALCKQELWFWTDQKQIALDSTHQAESNEAGAEACESHLPQKRQLQSVLSNLNHPSDWSLFLIVTDALWTNIKILKEHATISNY